MKGCAAYVPARRAGRLADTLYLVEHVGGWWTIVEEFAPGTSPRRTTHTRQRRSTAQRAIERAQQSGQRLVVWGSLRVPAAAVAPEDVPLLKEIEL